MDNLVDSSNDFMNGRINAIDARVKGMEEKLVQIRMAVEEIKGMIVDLNARFDFEVGKVIDVDPISGELEHD